MKLAIGERWERYHDEYREELEVRGIEEIDEQFETGTVVLPTDGDSKVEVRVTDTDSSEFFHGTVTLRSLVKRWERKT